MRLAAALLIATSLAAAQQQEDAPKPERAQAADAARAKQQDADAAKRAVLKKQLELLDRRIAVLAEQNRTALGAAELEKLRTNREAIALEVRRLDSDEKPAKPVDVPDIDKIVALARKGDAGARNALLQLKAKIDAVLAAPAAGAQGEVIARNGQIIIINGAQGQIGGLAQWGGRPAVSRPQPKEEEPKQAEPLPEEERKRLAEIDIEEQQKRAAALEKSIVELTRRAMELERRIEELRAQAAAAEKR